MLPPEVPVNPGGVAMIPHTSNPPLSEAELKLLHTAPEECLRHVVQRGALSLDQVTEGLSPQVTAVLRSIVTGERSPAPPDKEPEPERLATDLNEQYLRQPLEALGRPPTAAEVQTAQPAMERRTAGLPLERHQLSAHPQILDMVDRQILTPEEASQAVYAIDLALGRYLTGTLYAAP
jgi:hypothetical protein